VIKGKNPSEMGSLLTTKNDENTSKAIDNKKFNMTG
jgi:hypothetical protein